MCLLCMDILQDRTTCSCSNVGIILDEDGTYNIYVEDIRTVRLVNTYVDGTIEVNRQVLPAFDLQPFIDYKPLKESHINFKEYTTSYRNHKPTTESKYDTDLMAVLDKYQHHMAADNRIGSTRRVPKRRFNYS